MVRFHADEGRYEVEIGAADIGQGARTVLTQIAADALGVPADRVDVVIGDTALPPGVDRRRVGGHRVVGHDDRRRRRAVPRQVGRRPGRRRRGRRGQAGDNPWAADVAMAAYGAQFAEVAVHADTGEIRVPRMLGVFAAGRHRQPADWRGPSSSAA